MAECILLRGGGADLDVVTAGKPDVLAGRVIVDKDGEPLTGTMTNRGAVNQTLNAGGSYSIPEGYHNGSGKITANSLASQTPGTAISAHILSGQSAWVNGNKVDGAIPWQNADVAGSDRAWSQGMSNWAGTINLKVRNGCYLNGVNWIQQSIPEYQPWNIKKGVNIGGVIGTWEGYVPTATDLYLRGNNVAGFRTDQYAVFDAGQITFKSGGGGGNRSLYGNVNLTGYNYINFEGTFSGNYIGVGFGGSISAQVNVSGSGVWSINISSLQISGELRILFYIMTGVCYRIWLS